MFVPQQDPTERGRKMLINPSFGAGTEFGSRDFHRLSIGSTFGAGILLYGFLRDRSDVLLLLGSAIG